MELVGVREVADILGWPPGKVSVYVARGKLPKPVARLKAGPVWSREAIEAFARGETHHVADDNRAEVKAKREELADLERRVEERRMELARLERELARRRGEKPPAAVDLGREAEELLAVGVRVWSAWAAAGMIDSGSAPWRDTAFDRHQFAALALRLGVEQAIIRLLTWREEVWPSGAKEALDEALAALGPEYRVRAGRLERSRGGRWEKVRLA